MSDHLAEVDLPKAKLRMLVCRHLNLLGAPLESQTDTLSLFKGRQAE